MNSTESPSTQLEQVVARIAKLQRLADRGGTPEEAAAAASKVQELMAKHSISLAQVEIAAGEEQLSGYGHEMLSTGSASWKTRLLAVIALNTLCKAVQIKRPGAPPMVDVIGHRDSVKVVIELYEWLSGEIARMASLRWRTEGILMRGQRRESWTTAYRNGAVATVASRMNDERCRAERRSADTATLMVINDRVETVTQELYPNVRASRRVTVRGGPGYGAGSRDAADMQLAKPVAVSGERLRRLPGRA